MPTIFALNQNSQSQSRNNTFAPTVPRKRNPWRELKSQREKVPQTQATARLYEGIAKGAILIECKAAQKDYRGTQLSTTEIRCFTYFESMKCLDQRKHTLTQFSTQASPSKLASI